MDKTERSVLPLRAFVAMLVGLTCGMHGVSLWAQSSEQPVEAAVKAVEPPPDTVNMASGDEGETDDPVVEAPAAPELPVLLTLSEALNLANPDHPGLMAARAQQSAADAGVLGSQAGSGWKANLSLQGRLADRALGDDDGYINDSRYELQLSKLLYDFGASSAITAAADKQAAGSNMNLDYQTQMQRIEVMARYLDVVAADYQFAADNEAMTLAFFPWNRAQERMERFQGESEVTVLGLQSAYLKKLAVRNNTLRKQRKTRFKLASAMGWPDAKPDSVVEPDLSEYERPVPDYDELVVQVLDASPVLAQKHLALEAAEAQLQGALKTIRPALTLGLYASKFELPGGSTDDSRAMLTLDVPLLDGGQKKSSQAGAQAKVYTQQAELTGYAYQLRNQVMDWVQRLEELDAVLRDNEVEMNYRERALDKARLQYEMEVRAQIGRAQGEMAQAIYEGASARFERAVIWAQIDAMLGKPAAKVQ